MGAWARLRFLAAVRRSANRLRRPSSIARVVALKAADLGAVSELLSRCHTEREKIGGLLRHNGLEDLATFAVEVVKNSNVLPAGVSRIASEGIDAAAAASAAGKVAAWIVALGNHR